MSCSSLWGVRRDFTGEEVAEYSNSWLFCPVIWEALPNKVLPSHHLTSMYGTRRHISCGDVDLWEKTNEKMNASDNFADRICWELSNQSVFAIKDKGAVADAIRTFLEQNKEVLRNDEGIYTLQQSHIVNRFNEVASDIEALDESEYSFFVLKGTSVDDGVERWFYEYDEESGECRSAPLTHCNEAEFTIIQDGKIVGFKHVSDIVEENADGR